MLNAFLELLKWTAFIIVGYALIGEGDKPVLIALMAMVTLIAVAGFYRERSTSENP
jgi:hypothetical protein